MQTLSLCECRTNYTFLLLLIKPTAVYVPPRVSFLNARDIRCAIRNRNGMCRPRPNYFHIAVIMGIFMGDVSNHQLTRRFQNWREGHDVEAPENGFQFAEVCFG